MKKGGCWMLLDRNLASVVRDAPYAVDHLSARSQRPVISRDTCASLPDKKRRYVSRRVFVEKVLPQRATEKFRASFDLRSKIDLNSIQIFAKCSRYPVLRTSGTRGTRRRRDCKEFRVSRDSK